jgi:hypothetical protein
MVGLPFIVPVFLIRMPLSCSSEIVRAPGGVSVLKTAYRKWDCRMRHRLMGTVLC